MFSVSKFVNNRLLVTQFTFAKVLQLVIRAGKTSDLAYFNYYYNVFLLFSRCYNCTGRFKIFVITKLPLLKHVLYNIGNLLVCTMSILQKNRKTFYFVEKASEISI